MAVTITLTGKNEQYLKRLIREKPRLKYADVTAAANGEIEYADNRRTALAKDAATPLEQKHKAKPEKPKKEKKAAAKAEAKPAKGKAEKKADKPKAEAKAKAEKKAEPKKAAKSKSEAKPKKAAPKAKASAKPKRGEKKAAPAPQHEEQLENGSMEPLADQVEETEGEEYEAEL